MLAMQPYGVPANLAAVELDIPLAAGGRGVRDGLPDPERTDTAFNGHVGLLTDERFIEQEYPYQSKHYTRGRQSVESMNNFLKHGAHLPIDDPQKRPRRRWIAQFISLVTMVVATNTRKIIAWLIDQIGVSSISTAPVERARRRDFAHR